MFVGMMFTPFRPNTPHQILNMADWFSFRTMAPLLQTLALVTFARETYVMIAEGPSKYVIDNAINTGITV